MVQSARVNTCKDSDLKAILVYNRDEEKEQTTMVLEWIRREHLTFDEELKDFLLTDKLITHKQSLLPYQKEAL